MPRIDPIGASDFFADARVFVWRDGTIASWDRDARKMFGRLPEQVLGLPFSSLFTADCRDAVDRLAFAAPGDPMRVLATALDEDGTRFEAEVTSSRTLSVRDGAAGTVEVVRDVTERRAVEAGLVACSGPIDTTTALTALGDALSPWIPFLDLTLGIAEKGRVRQVQRERRAVNLLGSPDFRGRSGPLRPVVLHGLAVVVQDTQAGTFRVDSGLAARGVGSYVVMPLVVDERLFGTLNVAFGESGMATLRIVRLLAAVAGAIGPPLARTIEFEEKSRTVSRLEQVDRLKKELLAVIAHDMRTPLTVIAGFASSLREKWDDLQEDERLEGLDAILRHGRNLTRLVDEDLQFALTDTGELAYEIAPFDLAAQIRRIVDDFARTSGARFEVSLEEGLPLVRGDEQRNWQILANLLSNAVKFSPRGTLIEVEAFQRGPMVHVLVRDQGRGISPADCPKLFRKFSRVGSGDGSAVPGTGLGLYLSKCMVERQGGRIWVNSRRGIGSTFTYTLPLAEARLPLAEAGASLAGDRLR